MPSFPGNNCYPYQLLKGKFESIALKWAEHPEQDSLKGQCSWGFLELPCVSLTAPTSTFLVCVKLPLHGVSADVLISSGVVVSQHQQGRLCCGAECYSTQVTDLAAFPLELGYSR